LSLLAVFKYHDEQYGCLICCCSLLDYEKYSDSVLGMCDIIKGVSSVVDDAVQDYIVNLSLADELRGEIEFKVCDVEVHHSDSMHLH